MPGELGPLPDSDRSVSFVVLRPDLLTKSAMLVDNIKTSENTQFVGVLKVYIVPGTGKSIGSCLTQNLLRVVFEMKPGTWSNWAENIS